MLVAASHFGKGPANIGIKLRGQLGLHHPLANLCTGLRQRIHVIHIQCVERCMDTLVQTALLEEVTVGLGGSGKAPGNGYAGAGQVADHFAQGCVFAPYSLHIVDAELVKGNYVLYQDEFSTRDGKLRRDLLRAILA